MEGQKPDNRRPNTWPAGQWIPGAEALSPNAADAPTAGSQPTSGTWRLLHRGNPCIICGKPAGEQSTDGCPVTAEQLRSRIGDLTTASDEAWKEAGKATSALEESAITVKARALEKEVRRLTRLHEVLTEDMAPAGGGRAHPAVRPEGGADVSAPLVFTVSKADPVGEEPLPGAVLNITAYLPTADPALADSDWWAANMRRHARDARRIVSALAQLPQGTTDQVLILLLGQRASLLRVNRPESFPPEPGLEGLPENPPPAFVSAVEVTLEEARRDRPSPPAVTAQSAADALWFALRCVVPASAKEGA